MRILTSGKCSSTIKRHQESVFSFTVTNQEMDWGHKESCTWRCSASAYALKTVLGTYRLGRMLSEEIDNDSLVRTCTVRCNLSGILWKKVYQKRSMCLLKDLFRYCLWRSKIFSQILFDEPCLARMWLCWETSTHLHRPMVFVYSIDMFVCPILYFRAIFIYSTFKVQDLFAELV